MTINLSTAKPIVPGPEHGALAVAQVPFIPQADPAVVAAEAQKVGLVQVAPNQFQAPDKSWLVLNQGRIERGVGDKKFTGRLQNVLAFPVAAKGTHVYTAAAAISLAKPLAAQLVAKGFVQVSPNYHAHPDGSFVANVNGKSIRGFGQELLDPAEKAQKLPAVTAAQTRAASKTKVNAKAEKTIAAAWKDVGVRNFDKRWAALPNDVKAIFTNTPGNLAWMIGNDGDIDDGDSPWSGYFDRRFDQMCDTVHWHALLQSRGAVGAQPAKWREAMVLAGYSVDSGDTASVDGIANILAGMSSWGVKPETSVMVAALVGCTGSGGVNSELFLTKPTEAVARTRAIFKRAASTADAKANTQIRKFLKDPVLPFLDDPKERRAFADALVSVKLGDASRGQYGWTAPELAKGSMARDPKFTTYTAAAKK